MLQLKANNNYLKYYNVPVTIVATKVDKVGASKKDIITKLNNIPLKVYRFW